MRQVPIEQVKNDLAGYLQMAEKEYVIITQEGKPVGILIGLEDPEDLWEELLLRNPDFVERIAQARKSLKEGKGISMEQMRAKYDSRSL
ncbi:MAG TPA: prevent-host-death protein [Cyanobacteria bacterium UBA11369]|nr:prevent-host-death protein [Cyanobacteria bacterium UBA11371]HBE30822.1 prevent-host-death protein [Cyanobacteria bacterium UBA11368]HBE48504.1 prevent-host-death protein [Cyanobacteria bacterium UBA11369]